MDTIEVKMQSPTKKRAGDDNPSGRGGKRQITIPPRLTRSMLRKLNQNGGPPVELNPGLDMGVRRRGPRTRPPKRPAQDEAVVGSVKRTATERERAPGPIPQSTEPQPKETQPIEPQPIEPQPLKPQPLEPEPKEAQPTEPHHIQLPAAHQDKRVSEADVAAASRLAQAAIAAGLTGDTSEAGTPVDEDLPGLVRFTKKDLRDVLSDAVIGDEIRQMMEPHWLARMEFLTWLERPAADMHRIKKQIRRLAVRWSQDLQNQDAADVDIPISMLESWRADIVIVGGPSEDTDSSEARDEHGKTGDEMQGVEEEGDKKEPETEGDGNQATEEQDGEEEGDENAINHDSREVAEALVESVTLAARDMAEWKEAFDKEMAAEPDFRSKRAWAFRVSESQKEATTLQERVWKLDVHVHKSEWVTQSTIQAAYQLLDELQKFRIGLRMDREAFWDEFDQEGAEFLLRKTELDQTAEEETQEAAQEEEAQDIVAEKEDIQMTEVEAEKEDNQMTEPVAEKEDTQMTGLEAEVEDAQLMENEELQGSSTSDGGVSGVKPGPTEQPSRVATDDNDSNTATVKPEHPSDEKTTQENFPSVKREEPPLPFPARVADLQTNIDVPKAEERSLRSLIETYAGKGINPPREEDKSAQQPAAEFERHDQEGQAAEAGEKLNSREPTPWLPDKRGSHSPSWKWPDDHKTEFKVIDPDVTAAVEEDYKPPHEVGRDTSSELFSSRSASAEEASNEEIHTADQALTTSEVAGGPQNSSSIISSTQPEGIDRASGRAEDTTDQTLITSSTTRLLQDTSSAACSSRSASPEIIICEVQNTADSSSTASNISSLPGDTSSPTSERSEAGEEVEEENTVEMASAAPEVPEDTSLLQDTDPPTEGERMERSEETGGGTENTPDSTPSTSNIARLLEEVSLPQDTGSATTGTPSGSVEELGGEPGEEAEDQASAISLPQDTSPTTSGIPSGSDMGAGSEAGSTVEDPTATTSDAAGLPQGSSVGEDLDAPPAAGIEESRIIVNVRYIKPQWESLSSPEEPTYNANDFSATEVDDGDDEDDQVFDIDEVDDREADDVDP